jgi:hypothetical protein
MSSEQERAPQIEFISLHVVTLSMPWPQVLYYVRSPKHLEALWFANVGNQVLWWTYVKACWRAVGSIIAKKGITFKTTMKVPTPRNPGSAFQCTSEGHSISAGAAST